MNSGSAGAITDGVSTSAIVIYGAILCIVLYFIFLRNSACLQYGLDGTSWILGFKAQAAREPFSQLGVDPLQGNFDAYFPVFREYFLPEALALMFKGTDASKAVTYTVYGMLMVFATYALARSVGISRGVAFLGGALFAATALPTTLSNLSWIHGIYNIVPHLAQVTCVTIMIAACFWAIEVGRPIFTLALGLIAVALVILSAVSYVTATILMLPTIALYGGVSIFASRVPADALARIVVAAACIIIPTLGLMQYALAVGGYTAFSFFGQEFMQSRASPYFASILYQSEFLGKLVIIFGLIGAIFAAYTGPRKLRIFASTHVVATVAFQAVALLVVTFAEGYRGPSPNYFEYMVWPIMFLFAAFAMSLVWRLAGKALQYSTKPMSRHADLISRHGLLVAVPLFLASWNVAALASERTVNCAVTGFFPVRTNAITAHLERTIATRVDMPFRGLVATFGGVHEKASVDWFDLHRNDAQLWRETGNDLRLVGLWWYNIPTLMQYSPLITPPYYLLLTDFLSRPTDRQVRSVLVLTEPNERMLALWGVRFVISDFALGFGEPKERISVPGQEDVRLVELGGPNVGNYSPTEVRSVASFREGLRLMHEASFDGRHTLVTDDSLDGPFVRAEDAKLIYRKSGFSVSASSAGRSILVLPVQYSRCWSVSGEGGPILFRANLMQLGISFAGKLDAKLVFRFGPFLASACRIEDIKDMERLGIREAREH